MNRISWLEPKFVDAIPERVDPGVIYISRRYSTALHLCCCGCGLEVVTPLNPAKWELWGRPDTVSLAPSVGNWSFPCQSHYWITDNRILWAGPMSPKMIAAVRARDRLDAEEHGRTRVSLARTMMRLAQGMWRRVRRFIPWRFRK